MSGDELGDLSEMDRLHAETKLHAEVVRLRRREAALREYIDRMPYPSDMDQLRAERDRAEATIDRVRAAVESHIGAPCGCNAIAYQVRAAIEGTDS